jgi:hypothetical protein
MSTLVIDAPDALVDLYEKATPERRGQVLSAIQTTLGSPTREEHLARFHALADQISREIAESGISQEELDRMEAEFIAED